MAVDIVPGQAHEAPHLPRMVDATAARVGVVDEVVGDRAYDADRLRHELLVRGIMPQVPSKANRTDPWPLLKPAYRERNKVERLFAKLKGFRRVATRYDKLKASYLGFVHLALGFIRLRRSANVNRP